ncbi:LysR family transcriptional regulator, partial [Conexibacter stalactiti]
MELRQLACFVAVAEELSFTRAARRLHLVQSGVSASVRALERELDAALFERTTQRVALTGAGAALLPEARAALAAAQRASDAVARARGTVAGTLTIGTIQSASPLDLPAVLARFHAEHPGVTVRLRHGGAGSALLLEELQAGQLDVAFVSLERAPAGVELVPLSVEEIVLVCRRDDPLAGAPAAREAPAASEALAARAAPAAP